MQYSEKPKHGRTLNLNLYNQYIALTIILLTFEIDNIVDTLRFLDPCSSEKKVVDSSVSIPSSMAGTNIGWFSAGALELRRDEHDAVGVRYCGGEGVFESDLTPQTPLLSLLELG